MQVKAIDSGVRYIIGDPDFGPVESLDYDAITERFDCSGYTVAIIPVDEQAAWRALAGKPWVQLMGEQPRRQRQQAAELSPEQQFGLDEAKSAASEAAAEAEQAFTRKIRKRG